VQSYFGGLEGFHRTIGIMDLPIDAEEGLVGFSRLLEQLLEHVRFEDVVPHHEREWLMVNG
jgi:hypothetical protein